MLSKKFAVRISALVLVAVTGSGMISLETQVASGSVQADWNHCC